MLVTPHTVTPHGYTKFGYAKHIYAMWLMEAAAGGGGLHLISIRPVVSLQH